MASGVGVFRSRLVADRARRRSVPGNSALASPSRGRVVYSGPLPWARSLQIPNSKSWYYRRIEPRRHVAFMLPWLVFIARRRGFWERARGRTARDVGARRTNMTPHPVIASVHNPPHALSSLQLRASSFSTGPRRAPVSGPQNAFWGGGALGWKSLPETANRVETHVSCRKQTIEHLSTRDGSREEPARFPTRILGGPGFGSGDTPRGRARYPFALV